MIEVPNNGRSFFVGALHDEEGVIRCLEMLSERKFRGKSGDRLFSTGVNKEHFSECVNQSVNDLLGSDWFYFPSDENDHTLSVSTKNGPVLIVGDMHGEMEGQQDTVVNLINRHLAGIPIAWPIAKNAAVKIMNNLQCQSNSALPECLSLGNQLWIPSFSSAPEVLSLSDVFFLNRSIGVKPRHKAAPLKFGSTAQDGLAI